MYIYLLYYKGISTYLYLCICNTCGRNYITKVIYIYIGTYLYTYLLNIIIIHVTNDVERRPNKIRVR